MPVRLAILLLFLMVWGFSGIGKVQDGLPDWFRETFGKTLLGRFPGVAVSYWFVAALELSCAALALLALLRCEFLVSKSPFFLQACGVLGLFTFVVLGFGKWLTRDFAGAFQLFLYFAGTLLAVREIRAPQGN